jgi:hypothetical protein
MSIPILSTADWFRCIRGTSTEHHAALAKLVRMLCGDDRRTRPPVSLPGRSTAPPLTAEPLPATAPATVRYFRRAPPAGKVINAPSKDSDARDPYSREQLERMNARFHHALGRAIARGKEHPPCSTF